MSIEMEYFLYLYLAPAFLNILSVLIIFSQKKVVSRYELNRRDFRYFIQFSLTPFLNVIILLTTLFTIINKLTGEKNED